MPTPEIQFAPDKCPHCGQSLEPGSSQCVICGKEPSSAPGQSGAIDYFCVFSLPRRLQIDLSALERSFYKRSRELHPDRYARASAEEQQWSLEQTSLLNDAYRTLRDSVARTEHLLKLEGCVVEEQSSATTGIKEARVPADMLEEVFELNMQLEQMRMSRKMGEEDPEARADLERARTEFTAQLDALDAQLAEQWQRWDQAAESGAEAKPILDAMRSLLDRRRYLRNLVRDVNEALEV